MNYLAKLLMPVVTSIILIACGGDGETASEIPAIPEIPPPAIEAPEPILCDEGYKLNDAEECVPIITRKESVMALFMEMNTLQWEVLLPQQEAIYGSARFQECENQACLDEFVENDPDGTLDTYAEIYIEPHDIIIGNKDAIVFRILGYIDHVNHKEGHLNNYLAVFEDNNTYTLTEMSISGVSEASTIKDLNGDGLDDIYYATHGYDFEPFPGGQDKVFYQQSDGTFIEGELRQTLEFSHGSCSDDFDSNGLPDIVIAAGGTHKLKMNIGDSFVEENYWLPQKLLSNEYLAELGLIDFSYWEPEPHESWDDHLYTSRVGSAYWWCTTPDINRDGYPDIVLAGSGAHEEDKPGLMNYKRESINQHHLVMINDGTGMFNEEDAYYIEYDPMAEEFGYVWLHTSRIGNVDFDNDGQPDIFAFTGDYQKPFLLSIHMNNGHGDFTLEDTIIYNDWPAYYQVIGNSILIEDTALRAPKILSFVGGEFVYIDPSINELNQMTLKNLYIYSQRTAWE